MPETLRIFTAPGCAPCQDIKDAIDQGTLEVEGVSPKADVEMVDLSTDEGYPLIEELGIDAVPSAYYGDRRCQLLVDEETGAVTIDCGEPNDEEAPSGLTDESPPTEDPA